MAEDTRAERWPRFLRPFAARPRLMAGFLVSILVYVLSSQWIVRDVTRAIIAWDIGALTFIVLAMSSMVDCNHEQMKQRALRHDEGKHFILLLTLFAAVASVAALGAELATAKTAGAQQEGLRVLLSAGTIGLSWMFVQVVFAQHYAHHYYMEHEECAGEHREGLEFPGDEPPDYWDFLHFAVIIGATAQTADVTIVSKSLRRVATVHSMISFAFNTAILALMINLAAGLF
ncbi:MAG: DUF1345 domain-containing protein [Proteobacteria bacterium]|nr:DUF1345 domain-containing protein [Pseudomonadota bacterium]